MVALQVSEYVLYLFLVSSMDFIEKNWQTLFSGIGTEIVVGLVTILFGLLCFIVRRRSKAGSVTKVKMKNIVAGGSVSGRDTRK